MVACTTEAVRWETQTYCNAEQHLCFGRKMTNKKTLAALTIKGRARRVLETGSKANFLQGTVSAQLV